MSLLIPSLNDKEDAHANMHQVSVYQDMIKSLENEKNDRGEWKYPWKFEPVQGLFKQSDPKTDDLVFNYALDNFGIVKPWAEIKADLKQLNENAKPNESYKLIFFARHGQGYHNLVVDRYGLDEWNRYWHNQERDGDDIIGPDPMLTERGINQAKENNLAWKKQLASGAPLPEKFYVSPLTRSSLTLVYTWLDIALTESEVEAKPIVKEILRESIGVNICDKRSSKSALVSKFSKYGFQYEQDFTEEDELYTESSRENLSEHSLRCNEFLQFLFEQDWNSNKGIVEDEKDTIVSTTSHAGTIRGFITAIGHRTFTISTGGMIPIIVKATRRVD